MEKVVFKVGGMTCSSCAQGIVKHLEKRGLNNMHIDFDSGELEVDLEKNNDNDVNLIISDIKSLGYTAAKKGEEKQSVGLLKWLQTLEFRFVVSAFFTLPLFLHMFIGWHLLHLPLTQFLLATPVLIIGLIHFGKSAWGSIKNRMPNMDVLITLGSSAAFLYSCFGWYLHHGEPEAVNFLFFETSATIITLLLLGNIIEKKSLKKTQSALEALTRIQPQNARKIENALSDKEFTREVPVDQIFTNDLILVNTGEKIPADGIIYEGTAAIDQTTMTGESLPVDKGENDEVFCGTIVSNGHIKVIVKRAGGDTMLSQMIETVKKSTLQKPEIQRIGDKISSWFVPVVVAISMLTFSISFFYLQLDTSEALLRSIAVLVISCPCAMGLATPTAVAVGIGRAARNGILIKGGDTMERLQQIDTIVFDKTGTLTKGNFVIKNITYHSDNKFADFLIGTLEQYSTHPLAAPLAHQFMGSLSPFPISFSEIKEIPGSGVKAIDKDGNIYKIGSKQFTSAASTPEGHQVYLTRNDEVLAEIAFEDTVRSDAPELINYFKQNRIKTVLLSGDRNHICNELASKLKIDEVFAEKLPSEKVTIISELQRTSRVAMVGDGINDAPALAVASVGIAMSGSTQIASQTAEIVLLNKNELKALVQIHMMSKQVLLTIKQNLFWALFYNVIAIPMAAAGYLSPVIASFSMAFSDVVVIGNSLRLRYKKLLDLK